MASGDDKESPFMSPPALPLLFNDCVAFVTSVNATLRRCNGLLESLFLTSPSPLSPPNHHHPARSNLPRLSVARHWVCSPSIPLSQLTPSLTSAMLLSGVFLWLPYIWFGGRKRGCSPAHGDALMGDYIVSAVPSKCRWKYLSVIQFHPMQYT